MNHPHSTKGHQFGPLSYHTIGACIDVQRQLGLHCMEIDYQRALDVRRRSVAWFERHILGQQGQQ